jgi:hypothetical protein
MKIYVASSWRNPFYGITTAFLTECGHTIMDWKVNGFGWQEVSDKPKNEWTGPYYRDFVLKQTRAVQGFKNDMMKLHDADCVVLLLPSGRSAHIEAGICMGLGKPVYIYIPVFDEPELMYLAARGIFFKLEELAEALQDMEPIDQF